MNQTTANIRDLEARYERSRLDIQDLQRQLRTLRNQVREIQSNLPGGGIPGGPATIFTIPAVAITAGGSVTGQTVSALQGGSLVTVNANATVYNQMAAATVSTSGKTIPVGANGDGTFTVITQSC